MSKHPEVLWAQRSSSSDPKKNIIYLTINLPDIIESTLQCDLTATGLKFSAKAGNQAKGLEEKDYAFEIEFSGEIIPEESSRRFNLRAIDFILRKKELKTEYWPRLYKGPKLQFVKTNFDKWVDEDEQDEKPTIDDEDDFNPMGGMGGMPGMGGMGGMPGMGGMGGMPGMGGMGGMGGMDFEKMMADMQKNRAEKPEDGDGDLPSDDDDDDGPPPLENTPPAPST